MTVMSWFRRKALTASPAVVGALQDAAWSPYPVIGGTNLDVRQIRDAFVQAQSANYAYMYSKQPAVRTVVDYVARNVSQLGLKLYERVDDAERQSRGDHAAARTMRNPNPATPAGRFVFNLVADFLVFDNAYALKLRQDGQDELTLLGLPPHRVGVIGDNAFTVDAYRVWSADGSFTDFQAENVIHWRGYNPDDPRLGVSRLETLRQVLVEDATLQATNVEFLKAGMVTGGHIERPLEAPEWSLPARDRFAEDFRNRRKVSRGVPPAIPILEDGMKWVPSEITPKDAQMLEGRRFTLETVAKLYGLNGVPAEDEEARRQFYADVLPPLTSSLEETLELAILRDEYGETDLYFEFNLDEKLRGNVEEKLSTMVSVAGAPFMTRNEVRAMQNLPPLNGGEELITPLNVLVGSKPSVNEMPPQDPNGPPQDGSFREASLNGHVQTKQIESERHAAQRQRRDRYAGELKRVLVRHFTRQREATKSKDFKSLDDEKWDRELGEDLLKRFRSIVEREGGIAAARLMLPDFDLSRVDEYLKAAAAGRAHAINATTQREIDEQTFEDPLEQARTVRAEQSGLAMATSMASFAHREAAKQTPDDRQRTKTWVVTSAKSRHPEMGGETVPLYAAFSNGAQYPGDPSLSADEAAGCNCILSVS